MTLRFADLPVRTKFLVTLGIPVIGLVLIIGKQVDGSLKRHAVYTYIRVQAGRIGQLSEALHRVQCEGLATVRWLAGSGDRAALRALYDSTDRAVHKLSLPLPGDIPVEDSRALARLATLRGQAFAGNLTAAEVSAGYRAIGHDLLDDMGRTGRLALDPQTKDRLYAHLRLLSAKEALAAVCDLIGIAATMDRTDERFGGELAGYISLYETNIILFERDATPEVISAYHDAIRGAEVNFLRSIVGTAKERHGIAKGAVDPGHWWDLAALALDRFKQVEDRSLSLIVEATQANQHDARIRLILVLAALLGVVGAVTLMAILIMRGIRSTVDEVTRAARALAVGDVSAKVPVAGNDEIGRMAVSFNEMIDNIRSLASSAEAIGKGNYDTPVNVRGKQDVLGLALQRMRENLKAARLRDNEQTKALQDEKEKLERANERINLLIKEMHHRVKNNLQVIASLLRLQAGTIADERLQHAFDQSQSRVTSMALIHEKLYKGDELAKVDVAMYLEELFAELVKVNDVGERIACRSQVEPGIAFDLRTMVPLGLLFNELITNSLKHAFNGRDRGEVVLRLRHLGGDEYDLLYSDDGTGLPMEKLQHHGPTLGTSLIESLVGQLNGHMTVEGGPAGTHYHIRFRTR